MISPRSATANHELFERDILFNISDKSISSIEIMLTRATSCYHRSMRELTKAAILRAVVQGVSTVSPATVVIWVVVIAQDGTHERVALVFERMAFVLRMS